MKKGSILILLCFAAAFQEIFSAVRKAEIFGEQRVNILRESSDDETILSFLENYSLPSLADIGQVRDVRPERGFNEEQDGVGIIFQRQLMTTVHLNLLNAFRLQASLTDSFNSAQNITDFIQQDIYLQWLRLKLEEIGIRRQIAMTEHLGKIVKIDSSRKTIEMLCTSEEKLRVLIDIFNSEKVAYLNRLIELKEIDALADGVLDKNNLKSFQTELWGFSVSRNIMMGLWSWLQMYNETLSIPELNQIALPTEKFEPKFLIIGEVVFQSEEEFKSKEKKIFLESINDNFGKTEQLDSQEKPPFKLLPAIQNLLSAMKKLDDFQDKSVHHKVYGKWMLPLYDVMPHQNFHPLGCISENDNVDLKSDDFDDRKHFISRLLEIMREYMTQAFQMQAAQTAEATCIDLYLIKVYRDSWAPIKTEWVYQSKILLHHISIEIKKWEKLNNRPLCIPNGMQLLEMYFTDPNKYFTICTSFDQNRTKYLKSIWELEALEKRQNISLAEYNTALKNYVTSKIYMESDWMLLHAFKEVMPVPDLGFFLPSEKYVPTQTSVTHIQHQ